LGIINFVGARSSRPGRKTLPLHKHVEHKTKTRANTEVRPYN